LILAIFPKINVIVDNKFSLLIRSQLGSVILRWFDKKQLQNENTIFILLVSQPPIIALSLWYLALIMDWCIFHDLQKVNAHKQHSSSGEIKYIKQVKSIYFFISKCFLCSIFSITRVVFLFSESKIYLHGS